MPRHLRVHLLPELTQPREPGRSIVVIIDVLRASTTIAHALAAGIHSIVPCLEISEARERAEKNRANSQLGVLLGGERQGKPIPGFDLGNSPSEYTSDRVDGNRLMFTTTNGTRAMMRCLGAHRVLIGSFVNFSAISRSIENAPEIELVCAGTNGEVTREDVLFAGALATRQQAIDTKLVFNDSAQLACDVWQSIGGEAVSHQGLTQQLADTTGGRNLASINLSADIEIAARIDALTVVPELFLNDWQILAADQ
ncbi:MAG: 2-phosphosulfolactate phosphatase [Pirellulaceae bacterium]|nr:2-phosphosulfolactate phosphatase [Pirellulaceae bacterium]